MSGGQISQHRWFLLSNLMLSNFQIIQGPEILHGSCILHIPESKVSMQPATTKGKSVHAMWPKESYHWSLRLEATSKKTPRKKLPRKGRQFIKIRHYNLRLLQNEDCLKNEKGDILKSLYGPCGSLTFHRRCQELSMSKSTHIVFPYLLTNLVFCIVFGIIGFASRKFRLFCSLSCNKTFQITFTTN